MRVLLSYPTSAGIFDLAQSKEKKYHILYDEESLGEYSSVQDAVDALISNQTSTVIHPETQETIDTSTLGIPQDYTQWDSNY